MSSPLSVRERVMRYYQAYAPENLHKAEAALQTYKGQEERLMEDLVRKYGKPEPPVDGSRDESPPRASSPPSSQPLQQENSSASSPPPHSPARGLPPLASPVSMRRMSSGVQRNNNQQQQQALMTSFGAPEFSEGDDDEYYAPDSMVTALNSPRAALAEDPYASLRNKLVNDVGFSDAALKKMWEDAWLGKMPLSSYKKQWGDSVINSGLGLKLTHKAKPVQRWQKRYFVLVPNFLYYFDSDDAMSPCKGAVFLDRAKIKQEEIREKKAIVITPRVYKKPLEIVAEGDFSNFVFHFDPQKVQDVWFDLIDKVTRIPPTAAPPLIRSPSSMYRVPSSVSPTGVRRNASRGGVGFSPQQPQLTSPSFRTPVMQPAGSMLQLPASYAAGLTEQQRGVSAEADDLMIPGAEQTAVDDTHNSNNQQRPIEDASSHGGQAASHPAAAPSYHQQQQHHLSSQHVHYPQRNHHAPQHASSATTPDEHRRLLLQQQQLQEMLVAAQQQQNDILYRAQLQQEVVKVKQTLHVDDGDLKRRIVRVASEKDTRLLAEVLLHFVVESVSDLNSLWKLMSELDDLPRRAEPTPPSPAAATASNAGGRDSMDIAMAHHMRAEALAAEVQQLQRQLLAYQQQQSHGGSAIDSGITGLYPSAQSPLPALPNSLGYQAYVSQQLLSAQQQRRDEDAELQRQRIERNVTAVQRLQEAAPGGVDFYRTAIRSSTPPSQAHAGSLFSPSAATTTNQSAFHAPLPSTMSSTEDPQWQDRLLRMKQRKKAVETILNELPSR